MLYLGIDQHAKHLTVELLDEAGVVVERRQVSTQPKRVRQFLADLRERSEAAGGFMAILEICGFNDWLIKLLRKYGCREIVLVQPVAKRKHKTDRRDAHQLAEILWVNRHRLANGQRPRGLRRIHIGSERDQENRHLTAARQRVGREHTRTINRIKHLIRRHNLQHDCPTKGLDTRRARQWLESMPLSPLDRLQLNQLLETWDLLRKQKAELEEQIVLRQPEDAASLVLATIPGAAPYTALALACRVGPITRFSRPSALANYWGLTPSIDDSGNTTGRLGSITKQGSPTARFLLGQLVNHVLRADAAMKVWFRKIKRRRGSKIARVAVMRRVTTIIWHMLKTGEVYRCTRLIET